MEERMMNEEYHDILDLPDNVSLDTHVNQLETADDYEDYEGSDIGVLMMRLVFNDNI